MSCGRRLIVTARRPIAEHPRAACAIHELGSLIDPAREFAPTCRLQTSLSAAVPARGVALPLHALPPSPLKSRGRTSISSTPLSLLSRSRFSNRTLLGRAATRSRSGRIVLFQKKSGNTSCPCSSLSFECAAAVWTRSMRPRVASLAAPQRDVVLFSPSPTQ